MEGFGFKGGEGLKLWTLGWFVGLGVSGLPLPGIT